MTLSFKKIIDENKTVIMGILNLTPDSFSDGGHYVTTQEAVDRALQLIEEGADILDIGGESTRPNAKPVSINEELARVLPVITELSFLTDIPISIDTYKAEVARLCLEAGAVVINDITGLSGDPQMVEVAREHECPIVITHNSVLNSNYLIKELLRDFEMKINFAVSKGIQEENIIIDPGIGFSKTYEDNLIILRNIHELSSMGYPVLLGTSRKSVIYKALNLPIDDLIEGTAATVALGVFQGCNIIRVHDVKQMKRVAMMVDEIKLAQKVIAN
jgi:dihydropteroate synthase